MIVYVGMSALPDIKSVVSPEAVILLTTRGAPLLSQRLRLLGFASQLGLAVAGEVVFRRRRRGGSGEQLLSVLPTGVAVVVVERLSGLAKDPLAALLAVAEIRAAGVSVVSAEESFVLEIGAALPALGGWLASARRNQRSEEARARARADGRRVGGRPRKVIDIAVADRRVAEVGVARTAVEIGCGETTLRRALRSARAPMPVRSDWSPSVVLGGVQ